LDFDSEDEFEFLFDIALAPEFQVEFTDKDELNYYTIGVTDEIVDAQVKIYSQRHSKYEKVESYQDNDMLKGTITEFDENGNSKEGGIRIENEVVLMPNYIKGEEQKTLFSNAKLNDTIVFNPHKAYEGDGAEIASLLKVEKNKASEITSDFGFQIQEITRYMAGELNQEFFNGIYGEDVVKTEEEFRAKVKEDIIARNLVESDYKFMADVRKLLLEKVGSSMQFSEKLLKRIFLLNVKDKGEEYVNEHYDDSIKALKWQLIKEKLASANNIKVEETEISDAAKETAKTQFAQYGMISIPTDVMDSYAKEMMNKEEAVNNLANRVIENKLVAALKTQITLINQTVTPEEFDKLFEQQ
jgi:trigger factor